MDTAPAVIGSAWTGTQWMTYCVGSDGSLWLAASLTPTHSTEQRLRIGSYPSEQAAHVNALRCLARHRRFASTDGPKGYGQDAGWLREQLASCEEYVWTTDPVDETSVGFADLASALDCVIVAPAPARD